MSAVSVTTLSREDTPGRTGGGRWLDLIHRVNRIAPGTFGEPVITPGRVDGLYTETYADAFVTIDDDDEPGFTTVRSSTPHGAALIRQAAEELGLEVTVHINSGGGAA